MNRLPQLLLILTFLAFSWLAMQVVHESGHVLFAHLTGGQILKVSLHPLIFSRTELTENPHPLAVVWGGPLIGALLPLSLLGGAALLRLPGLYLFRFFAGFCLIANGAYIGAGPWLSEGADPWVLTQHGSPRWLLILFGLLTVPLGFYLWHRQGPHFGLGPARGRVQRGAVLTSTALLLLLTLSELICNVR